MASITHRRNAVLGAAFLMATSAIGPGFLTQTATFTNTLLASFWLCDFAIDFVRYWCSA